MVEINQAPARQIADTRAAELLASIQKTISYASAICADPYVESCLLSVAGQLRKLAPQVARLEDANRAG